MLDDADLDRLCPLPPHPDTLPRVIRRDHAIRLGYSRRAIGHRLQTGHWRRLLPRTYLTVDTLTERDRYDAALLFAGRGAALSGAAALRCSEVRGVREPKRVLVLVPPANRIESVGWVSVRATTRPMRINAWLGPRRVEVARATADLALTMQTLPDVRALVARVVQHGHCSLAELGAELAEGPRQDSGFLRRALAEVGWGAESAPEAEAARLLRAAGDTGFVQNFELTLPGGLRRIDFYWPHLRACLEIDSVEWHFAAAEWARTWDRHLELTTAGYSVIHRPPSALRDPERFVRDVRTWLAGRAAELGGRPA